jgi:hypothetical protein
LVEWGQGIYSSIRRWHYHFYGARFRKGPQYETYIMHLWTTFGVKINFHNSENFYFGKA